MTYRDRRLARADRLRHWATKRQARRDAAFESARRLADAIPLGQPILVGHHSERRARRDAERIHANMSEGMEHQRMADRMTGRANEIERQADHAIYSDDVDAIERLQDKIARLEAERARVKAINTCVRRHGLHALRTHLDPPATDAELAELTALARVCPQHDVEHHGFPSYTLQNLGGTLTRARQRLQYLTGAAATGMSTRTAADSTHLVSPTTATARAGLTILAGMTTPSRPGKTARPVWTVRGNLAAWRPMLIQLGGQWYRGAFSFWEDPTDAIERACLEAEQDSACESPP